MNLSIPDKVVKNVRMVDVVRISGSLFVINVQFQDGLMEKVFSDTSGKLDRVRITADENGEVTIWINGKGVKRHVK